MSKSPFPGMDPYLEDPAFWPDFHQTFIGCWREDIADQLPDAYEARLDERVNLVKMSPEVIKLIYPDVSISHRPTSGRGRSNGAGTLLLEPVSVANEFYEEMRETRINILHRPDRKLVAVLELLSPTNKTGDGLIEYSVKRIEILAQKIHLVELDLLLGGTRISMREPLPAADYYVFLSRADSRPNCDLFRWQLRHPLPTIPIPLRAPDPDILIDLAKVFQATYERGRYARSLFYGKKPSAPMSARDARWAVSLSNKK